MREEGQDVESFLLLFMTLPLTARRRREGKGGHRKEAERKENARRTSCLNRTAPSDLPLPLDEPGVGVELDLPGADEEEGRGAAEEEEEEAEDGKRWGSDWALSASEDKSSKGFETC